MCGILGGWSLNVLDKQLIDEAILSLKTRGPDDNGNEIVNLDQLGQVFMAHTRLSIIDLSKDGHQPMISPDGRYLFVFNGEIYNFKELRAELENFGYSFRSNSDSEVLFYAWLHWRERCLPRLIGMFSFVVYDKHLMQFWCVRDAFGIKPLFYSFENNTFVFASNIQAILAMRMIKAQVNIQRAYDYLVYGNYDCHEQSFFEGIKQVLPGQLLSFDVKSRSLSEPTIWWTPPCELKNALSFNDAAEEVRELLLEGLKLHLRSDVPLGVTLSGGIDSSALVCSMRHIEPDRPIHTFSFVAANSSVSEEYWIDMINDHTNTIPHKVFIDQDELAQDLDDMIYAQGEPFGGTSIYAQYRVLKSAKECGMSVILEGQGADEVFAGYHGYPTQRILSFIEQYQFLSAFNFMSQWSKWPGRGIAKSILHTGQSILPEQLSFLTYRLRGVKPNPTWFNTSIANDLGINTKLMASYKKSTHCYGRRVIEKLAYDIQHNGLPQLLRHGDRNSMRFSIENRVPFLTIPLVERLFSLPEHYLISNSGETKSILREAMRGIVPDAAIYRRDKIGFATPEDTWFRNIRSTIHKWLKNGHDIPLLQMKPLLNQFEQIKSGKKGGTLQVWRWINFIKWHQQFIAR